MDQLGNLSVVNNEEDITVVFVEWKQGIIPICVYLEITANVSWWSSNFGYSLEENSLRRLTSFQKFKKKELDEELEARSIEITDETKPNL